MVHMNVPNWYLTWQMTWPENVKQNYLSAGPLASKHKVDWQFVNFIRNYNIIHDLKYILRMITLNDFFYNNNEHPTKKKTPLLGVA